jgi:hypothetical protein
MSKTCLHWSLWPLNVSEIHQGHLNLFRNKSILYTTQHAEFLIQKCSSHCSSDGCVRVGEGADTKQEGCLVLAEGHQGFHLSVLQGIDVLSLNGCVIRGWRPCTVKAFKIILWDTWIICIKFWVKNTLYQVHWAIISSC